MAAEQEGQNSDFILSIQTIHLPKFQGAYNPSLIEYQGGYLLVFRHDTFKSPLWSFPKAFRHRIGYLLLDANFKPVSQPRLILKDYFSDPRIFNIGDQIYLSFGSPQSKDEPTCLGSAKLNISHLAMQSKKGLVASRPLGLSVHLQKKLEKNWVPFSYKNQLYMAYSIHPHRIVKPDLTTGFCQDVYSTNSDLHWQHGPLRGGTPALLVDGQYLAFFHSSVFYPHLDRYRYFIGAYQFSCEPPFEIKKISKKPFVHSDFYSAKKGELTGADVIFPGGFVVKGDKIFLIYGENDAAIKMMVLDKTKLLEGLDFVE